MPACCFLLGLCYVVSYLLVSSLTVARVDTYLRTEADECHGFYALQRELGVQNEAVRETRSEGEKDMLFRIMDPSGKILFQTDSAAWRRAHLDPVILREVAATGTPHS